MDDFLHAGDDIFEETIMNMLRQRFLAGKVEEGNFKYIGFQIKQSENGILLDHSAYMDKLDQPQMDPVRASQRQDLLNEHEQSEYRRLNWSIELGSTRIASRFSV